MCCFSNSFFMVKCVLVFSKVLNHFISLNINLIEIFLLTTVDNLVIYIENENYKDFTMEDGERLI